MSIEGILLIITFIILVYFTIKYLDLRNNYPPYIVFVVVIGLSNTVISQALVLGGFFEFPWRVFSNYTLTNIIYDMVLLPIFALLMINTGLYREKIWTFLVYFVAFTTAQDYLVERYTGLLQFKKWTLVHTVISSSMAFFIWKIFYIWLEKHFLSRRKI